MDPCSANLSFLDWGSGYGFNTTNSYIGIGVAANYGTNLYLNLRDSNQTTTDYYFKWLGPVQYDGHWHHMAIVKKGTQAIVYSDYLPIRTNTLSAYAQGSYLFDTNMSLLIGRTLNNGDSSTTNHEYDKIRFAARDLSPNEFIQPGQPIILSSSNTPSASSWSLSCMTISGKNYYVSGNASITDGGGWMNLTNLTAQGHYTTFPLPADTGAARFIRLSRLDDKS